MGTVEQLFQDVQSRQDRAASIAASSVDDNPDDAAEAIKLGNITGAPASAIYDDVDKFKSVAKSNLSGDIVAHNAMIADYVASHPLAAKVSNDDWANLDTISQGAQSTSTLIRLLNAPRSIAEATAGGAAEGFQQGWGASMEQEVKDIIHRNPNFYDQHHAAFVSMLLPWVLMKAAAKEFSGIGAAAVGGIEGAAREAHFAMFGAHNLADRFGSDAAYLAEYLMTKGEMPKLPALYQPELRHWLENGMEPPRGVDPIVDKGKADLNASVLEKVEQGLKDSQTSTTRERSREMYRQYMDQHYGDISVSVHGDAVSALYGDKVPEEGDGLLGWVKGIQDQLNAARTTGADIHLPLKDLMTDLDENVFKALKDDIRVWPGGVTAREAQEITEPIIPQVTIAYDPAVNIGGKIFRGQNHSDALERASGQLGVSIDDLISGAGGEAGVFNNLDGFVNSDGQFVPRAEAYKAVETAYKQVIDSPLTVVRGASGIEPMFSIGDRKLSLKNEKLLSDEEWAKEYDLPLEDVPQWRAGYARMEEGTDQHLILDDKGNTVGALTVTPQGKQLYVDGISGLSGFGPNDFGPSLIRDLKRQLKALYPDLETITGNRVSGARYGKAANRVSLEEKYTPDVKLNLADDVTKLRALLSDAASPTIAIYRGLEALVGPLTERAERLNRAVEGELRRMVGGGVEVIPSYGITTKFGETAEGAYIRRSGLLPAVLYDVFGADPIGTIRHEGMHYLLDNMPRAMRDTLEEAAQQEGWYQKHGILERYHNYSPEVQIQEAIVAEYQEWARSQVPHPNAQVHGIFEKLKAFWEALKQKLTEIFGDEPTWQQLFQQIHEGRLADLQAKEGALEPRFALGNEFDRMRGAVHGLDINSYRRIQEHVQKQYEADLEAAQKRADRDQSRRQTKEWKANSEALSAEIEENLRTRPDVAADLFLGAGEVGGKKLRQRYTLRAEDLSDEQKAGLPPHYVSVHGLPIDQVAAMFGHRSSDEMVRQLSEYNALKEGRSPREQLKYLVEGETERQMEARHGDLQHNIMTEAMDQAFSEASLNRMSEEMYAVAMAQKVEVIDRNVAKEEIQNQFQNSIISQVNSAADRDRVGHDSREIERDAIAGDWASVAQGLQRKFLNSLNVAEALKLEKEIATARRDFKRLSKDVVPGLAPEYANYIHQILTQIGWPIKPNLETIRARIEGREAGNLQDFVASKASMLREMPVWEQLYDGTWNKEFSQLSVNEFRAVRDSVKTLAFHGRDELKIAKGTDRRSLDEVKSQIIDNIKTFTEKHYDRNAQRWLGPIPPGKVSDIFRAYGVSHLQVPTMLERMDRADPEGPLTQYVTRPLLEGDGMLGRYKKQFSKMLLETDDGIDMRKSIDNDLFVVPGSSTGPMHMTRGNLRVVMLNLGTNLEKLAGGYHVTPDAVLRWVNKHATQEDWAWVNKIWDVFEKRRELSDEMYRSLTGGVEAARVEGRDIETDKFSTVRGRYYPIIHHPDFPTPSAKLIGGLTQDNFVSAMPVAGYMKPRVRDTTPIALDLDMLPARLSQELRDISLRPALIQASKILLDKDVQAAIFTHLGKEWRNQLQPYLRDIANGGNYVPKDQKALTGALEFIRTNAMSTLVGANLGTVAKHGPTAWALSMREVGPTNFLAAMKGLFSLNEETGERNWRYMMDKSNIMPFRSTSFEETLTGATQKLLTGGSFGGKLDSMRHWIIKASTYPLMISDTISAWPTWLAQYQKSLREGASEGDAIFMADRAVQHAHGSSSIVYKPGVVRNNTRWITGFYTLFSNVLQRQFEFVWNSGETLKLAKSDKAAAMRQVPGLAGQLFTYVIVPALIEEMVSPLTTKDHESWGLKSVKSLLYGLSSSWIGIRDFAHYALTGSDPTVGLFTTAYKTLGSVAEDIAQAGGLAHQPHSPAHAQKVIEDASNLVGLATGLPGGAAGKAGAFGYGLAKGIEHPHDGWDWVHGVRHGTVRGRH